MKFSLSGATLANVQSGQFMNPGVTVTNVSLGTDNVFSIHAQYTQDIADSVLTFSMGGQNYYYNYGPTIPALYYT